MEREMSPAEKMIMGVGMIEQAKGNMIYLDKIFVNWALGNRGDKNERIKVRNKCKAGSDKIREILDDFDKVCEEVLRD